MCSSLLRGHFPSRDAMIVAGLERALQDGEAASASAEQGKSVRTVRSVLNGYLSGAHRDRPAPGCAVGALAGDVARADAPVRKVMANKMEQYIDLIATAAGGGEGAENFALAAWSTMVGALTLSRVFAGDPRSDRILDEAKRAVLELHASRFENLERSA